MRLPLQPTRPAAAKPTSETLRETHRGDLLSLMMLSLAVVYRPARPASNRAHGAGLAGRYLGIDPVVLAGAS